MKNLWNRISNFFEHGDLVPFAVVISIWHFAKALESRGENIGIAIASGIFVDMLHFRTVRYAVKSRARSHVAIAILTTAISYSFHLLFYAADGLTPIDYLLAVPLPVGIPILAWQQAMRGEAGTVSRWRQRVRAVVKIAKAHRLRVSELENELHQITERLQIMTEEVNTLQSSVSRLSDAESELSDARKELSALRKQVDSGMINLDSLPPKFAAVTRAIVNGDALNGQLVTKHGIAQTTLDRVASLVKE